MKVQTQAIRVKAAAEKTYAVVSNIENLPKWATEFCLTLNKVGADYKVGTPMGEIFFRIDADAKSGIVDMWGGPTKEQMMRWPARVIDDNQGGAVFTFTVIQSPGQPDQAFEGQVQSLNHELENIRKAIET